jgi:hypothetical protein
MNEKKTKARLLLLKELTPETLKQVQGGASSAAATAAKESAEAFSCTVPDL